QRCKRSEKKMEATAKDRLTHLTKGTAMAWGSGENAYKFLSGFSGMKLQKKTFRTAVGSMAPDVSDPASKPKNCRSCLRFRLCFTNLHYLCSSRGFCNPLVVRGV